MILRSFINTAQVNNLFYENLDLLVLHLILEI